MLERLRLPLVEGVEAIGAIQAQYRPAVPVALWSRLEGFDLAELNEEFERRELVVGTLLRGTIHAVSAREHPYYARAVEESGVTDWRRTKAEPVPEMAELRRRLVEHAANSRTAEDLAGFIEEWIGRRKPALGADELEIQRKYGWRPFLTHSALVRVTSKDEWNSGRPKEAYEAVPRSAASPDAAVQFVIRAHLRAFGPASIADVAAWTGLRTPVLRAAVERLQPELERFEDEAGRTLYDLRGAPLPDPEVPAPVRLLPWFDSVVLAYEPAQRARILPDQYRDLVYQRVRLQWLPTFLVDGLVAGTWALRADKRAATLSLQPFESLPKGVRSELEAEAERLLDATRPAVTRRRVVWA